jgi:hypothetical protein
MTIIIIFSVFESGYYIAHAQVWQIQSTAYFSEGTQIFYHTKGVWKSINFAFSDALRLCARCSGVVLRGEC